MLRYKLLLAATVWLSPPKKQPARLDCKSLGLTSLMDSWTSELTCVLMALGVERAPTDHILKRLPKQRSLRRSELATSSFLFLVAMAST